MKARRTFVLRAFLYAWNMSQKYDLNDLSAITGLTEAQAALRLKEEGFNELPSSGKRSFLAIVFEVIREPMLLLLIGGGIIYMILGDIEEALMLLAFVFVIIGITIYQERRTERTLEALRDLSSPRALVIRENETRRIAGREVVREDIIVLAEGDRVPADGIILSCNNLTVEESILTGESVSVTKCGTQDTVSAMERPGGEDTPFVFSGTLVVSGLAVVKVLATGISTEFGKIGRSLQSIGPENTRLQKETNKLVRNLAILGLSISLVLFIFYGATRSDWLHGLLAGITLAMAVLPEEFPVVLTVFLAIGAWRISRNRVLTRRMPAVEALGSDTVLCVDKTGTLTMNRMMLSRVFAGNEFFNINSPAENAPPEKFHELIEFSILASQTDPFDPMEKALRDMGVSYKSLNEHLHANWSFMREYPLSRELLALSRVWKSTEGDNYIIAAKGAPEAIFDLCHLEKSEIERLLAKIESMAGDGLRVLGVARSQFQPQSLPGSQHDFVFSFLGLIGFADPVRPAVPPSIRECYGAGVRVVMITGDYPTTARRIAADIGLKNPDAIITGAEMNLLSETQLQERIKDVNVYARVVPEQKLRLVNAFKANGEVVAMTGDGVNDAPALKSANIGIAMGGRGTDVAREAAGLVLLDDDFSSIVKAIRMGRRIFDNLRKAMAYILAVHVPIAGLSLIPVLLGWPLILMPVHVLFLELIIDPASSIAFEAEEAEADIMQRPPRSISEPMLTRRIIIMSVLQGIIVLAITLFIYGYVHGKDQNLARTLTFTTLVLANLGLILTNRFRSGILRGFYTRNVAFWIITAATIVFLALVIYVPALRSLFKFEILHLNDILIVVSGGLIAIFACELIKYLTREKQPRRDINL